MNYSKAQSQPCRQKLRDSITYCPPRFDIHPFHEEADSEVPLIRVFSTVLLKYAPHVQSSGTGAGDF